MSIRSLVLAGLVAAGVATHAAAVAATISPASAVALAAGEIPIGDVGYPGTSMQPAAAPSRDHVKREVRRALAAHELRFGDVAYPDNGPVTVPRATTRRHAASRPTSTTTPPAS